MPTQQIAIDATIDAPLADVWEAFTTPEAITRWNYASDDWRCPHAEVDLRVGGIYSARMEAKDGSVGFDFAAVYEEVVPESAVTLAMADGRKARTTFEPLQAGVKVTTVFDAEDMNPIDMQRGGWQAILNNFKKYVETQSGGV